jgi:hypothetical protein
MKISYQYKRVSKVTSSKDSWVGASSTCLTILMKLGCPIKKDRNQGKGCYTYELLQPVFQVNPHYRVLQTCQIQVKWGEFSINS